MKCKRPKCSRQANRQGLCHQHYEHAPVRGYVDGEPTRERLRLLLARGVGFRGIYEQTGLSVYWLMNSTSRVQALTEQKVFSIPVPRAVVPGGFIPALGTHRRIQALSAIGWAQTVLGPKVGRAPQWANQLLARDVIRSATAAVVDNLYRELHMTPGPSKQARLTASRHRWAPPLAWDDIDDPDEKPKLGRRKTVTASERIAELHQLGIRDPREIAKRLGIQPDSVKQQLRREVA